MPHRMSVLLSLGWNGGESWGREIPVSPSAGVVCAGLTALFCVPVQGQVVNGDFETGLLPPWVITRTPSGANLSPGDVITFDIDGPGPHAPSRVAGLGVGRAFPGTAPEGATLAQSALLSHTRPYTLRFSWAVWAQVNVYSRSGGTFELVVDGAAVAQTVAPVTVQGHTDYGELSARFRPATTGAHTIGVRITRTTTAGEEVFQYIDDFTATPGCPTDYDDGSGTGTPDGGVSIDDLIYDFGLFGVGDGRADLDDGRGTGTPDGGVTVDDLLYDLSFFAAGC